MRGGDYQRFTSWLAPFAVFVVVGIAAIWLAKQWWFWPESLILAAIIVLIIAFIFLRNRFSDRPHRW